jgi:hypothetical protein
MDPAIAQAYGPLARELVRALRGRRSQLGLSRRLGYTTNAVYTWEAGAAWPSAARFFALARRVGKGLDAAALRRFFRDVPANLQRANFGEPAGVRELLVTLQGRTRIGALAATSGLSRFALSRWLSGKGQPRLPELLCYVEHSSLRLLDFLGVMVDPTQLPSTRASWTRLQAARAVGYEHPYSHAVLRALEIADYRKRAHRPGLIARAVGISAELEAQCLQKLAASGHIRKRRGRWVPEAVELVDFRREPEAAQWLKAFWAGVAAERSRTQRPGLFAYNVFAVSRADLARLEVLLRDYLQEMRAIVAASEPSELVALANVQLFAMEDA